MEYKALKRIKFDREYAAGEIINTDVIFPNMIDKLVKCKLIAETCEVEQVKPDETIKDEAPKSKKRQRGETDGKDIQL